MGRTSTRYKIRYQAEQIDRYFGRILDSAQFLDELAEGKSTYINETLPVFILGVNECQKLWEKIKEGL